MKKLMILLSMIYDNNPINFNRLSNRLSKFFVKIFKSVSPLFSASLIVDSLSNSVLIKILIAENVVDDSSSQSNVLQAVNLQS